MPRYSATTIVWAFCTCADTSATTAFFVVKIETHGSFLLSVTRDGNIRRTHGDLGSGSPSRLREANILF